VPAENAAVVGATHQRLQALPCRLVTAKVALLKMLAWKHPKLSIFLDKMRVESALIYTKLVPFPWPSMCGGGGYSDVFVKSIV
jgi:hypothetical protein